VQGDFSFHGKGTGKFLPAKYDAAAKMCEMSLEKSSNARRRAETI
jgi:hypothetical protein